MDAVRKMSRRFLARPQDEGIRSTEDYQPRLPSNNRYDYYLAAGRLLMKALDEEIEYHRQPPTEASIRYLERHRKALDLLIQGASRPQCFLPYTVSFNTLFTDLSNLRQLARLLVLRIRYDLATEDGMDAVKHFQVGIRFVRDVQGSGVVLDYLVGVAMEALISSPFREQIDYFSAKECRLLVNHLRGVEAEPEPLMSALRHDFEVDRRFLRTLQNDQESTPEQMEMLEGLLSFAESGESEEETSKPTPEVEEIRKVMQDPLSRRAFLARVLDLFEQYHQQLMDGLQRPWGAQQVPSPPEPSGDLASFFINSVIFSGGNSLLNRALLMRTERRLLMLRFALRAYKLRYGSYPQRLEDLKLGDLILDPFTGKPFAYRLVGDTYELRSGEKEKRFPNR